MKIKNLELKGFACLAPMAGVADRAMRELCVEYGASYVVGELASSKGISMGDRKSAELLSVSDKERPAAIQLFGNEPDVMAVAAESALKYKPDVIDINMGCPAPKVTGNGGGSSLMKNPKLAGEIVKAVCKKVDIPVTVKMRTGWNDENINATELAKICEYNGASAICVHGRTREQMYAPPVNLDVIKEVKKSVNIPVIGNGDITDGISAKFMYEYTGCDHIMVGRGALGRPWVFKMINEYMENGTVSDEPDIQYRMETLKRHITLLTEYKGEYIGMREARKHTAWYIKGIHGAAKYRNRVGSIKTLNDLYTLCDEVSQSGENGNENNNCFDSFGLNNIYRKGDKK